MNSFICRLTGGHKYDDCNQKVEQCPDDIRILWVSNFCTKCGAMHFWIADVDDIKEMEVESNV
jgi:hypothetical protein